MRILILGSPKTGTTYLFYMIKKVMPDDTACFFEPESHDDQTELLSHSSVLTKFLITGNSFGSLMKPEALARYDKTILLVRDPRDMLVSTFMYHIYENSITADLARFAAFMTLLRIKEEDPSAFSMKALIDLQAQINDSSPLEITEFVCNNIGLSSLILEKWADKLILLKYEDMVAGKLAAVESYLGLNLIPTDTEIPLEHKVVTRSKASGDWKNWYRPEDEDWCKRLFGTYVGKFGYADEWDLPKVTQLDAERASRYAMRVAWAKGSLAPVRFLWESFSPDKQVLDNLLLGKEAYLPYLYATEKMEVPSTGAVILNPRIENLDGQVVNVLQREQQYFFVYEVKFVRGVENVGFWMGLGSVERGTILGNGTPLHGQVFDRFNPGDKVTVRFNIACAAIDPDIYFLDAVVTVNRSPFEVEYLHRLLKCCVFCVNQRKLRDSWLQRPELAVECPHRPELSGE